jgi:hypothetical protein
MVSGTSLAAERPSVLPSKTSVWIKVFDRREKMQWPANGLHPKVVRQSSFLQQLV